MLWQRSETNLSFTEYNVRVRRRTSVDFGTCDDKENVLGLPDSNSRYIRHRLQALHNQNKKFLTQQNRHSQHLWTDILLAGRVLNSGHLSINTPENLSPYAQILGRGRHDIQIKPPLIISICL